MKRSKRRKQNYIEVVHPRKTRLQISLQKASTFQILPESAKNRVRFGPRTHLVGKVTETNDVWNFFLPFEFSKFPLILHVTYWVIAGYIDWLTYWSLKRMCDLLTDGFIATVLLVQSHHWDFRNKEEMMKLGYRNELGYRNMYRNRNRKKNI